MPGREGTQVPLATGWVVVVIYFLYIQRGNVTSGLEHPLTKQKMENVFILSGELDGDFAGEATEVSTKAV